MARYVFDLETDGLLDKVTKVHSLVLKNIDTGERLSCADQPGFPSIVRGLQVLTDADEIIGQNIIAYDLEVLKKLFSWDVPANTSMKVTDTLILARFLYPDLGDWDAKLIRRKQLPGNLFGRHSLEAWGYRLKMHKGDFKGPWEKWTPEMQEYCERDVDVTCELYARMMKKNPSPVAVELEHDVARLCYQIERNGFLFNEKAAVTLWHDLEDQRDKLTAKLRELFPPWIAPKRVKGTAIKTPTKSRRVKNKITGVRDEYTEGVSYSAIKLVVFNPLSRDHIADRLTNKYGWKPKDFTDKGKPKIDEKVLSALQYPEAKVLAELMMLDKRVSQLATGDEAWLKKIAPDGRIHARYNSNGTVTGRSSHYSPNIAQVPKVGKPFGKECRSLFVAPPGYKMLGTDAKGLELRCLGHYLSRWDNGYYADIVVNGDPHTVNMEAMELKKWFSVTEVARDTAKREAYAILYGAGDWKVGIVIIGDPRAENIKVLINSETGNPDFDLTARRIGKRLKKNWKKGIRGLGELIEAIGARVDEKGYLVGIDGRHLKIRSKHAALNTLLQSCGAILCKGWMVRFERYMKEAGYKHGVGKDYAIVAWVHDELQIEVKEGLEDAVGKIAQRAARDTGLEFEFNPPFEADYKAGANWAETH